MLVPIPGSFCFTDHTQNKGGIKSIIILNQIDANKVKLNTKRGMDPCYADFTGYPPSRRCCDEEKEMIR